MHTLLQDGVSLRATLNYLHSNCAEPCLRRDIAKLKMIIAVVKDNDEAIRQLTIDIPSTQRMLESLDLVLYSMFMVEIRTIKSSEVAHMIRGYNFLDEVNNAIQRATMGFTSPVLS